MAKTLLYNIRKYFHKLCHVLCLCLSFPLVAEDHGCNCEYCEFNYAELEEYAPIFREFENQIELEEQEEIEASVVKKWSKKLKRWLKKRVSNLFKKCVKFKSLTSVDECAYTVAQFKRKLDKHYETGSLEEMLKKFDENIPVEAREDFHHFKDRIRYFYYNKHMRPVQKLKTQEKIRDELDQYPIRTLLGGVELACGILMCVLPFPACRALGAWMIGHGTSQIYEGYMNKYEEDQKMACISIS